MISPEMTGPLAAFVAGLVTSLHCVGMCGPIGCALCSQSCWQERWRAVALYHGGRVLAYAAIGFAAGWVGEGVSRFLLGGGTRAAVWVFVLYFVAVVLGFDKRLKMKGLGEWFSRVVGVRMGRWWGAGVVGLGTPLLPCVPLYMAFAAAGLAGSGWMGAVMMGAFGLGTVPLMGATQGGMGFLERGWGPE
ncbi:MAG: sulfite exporter TauE/SafE family protein, partial [Chthoniobacterales bacterium]|nr:sulfite exporter TauE/SafE family protein [Chthoniobacterales bacterium]